MSFYQAARIEREYVAWVVPVNGGTMAVTVCASSPEDARSKLLKMGYVDVLHIA